MFAVHSDGIEMRRLILERFSAGALVGAAMLLGAGALVGLAVPRVLAGLQAAPVLQILEPHAQLPLTARTTAELAAADRRLARAEAQEPHDFNTAQARTMILAARASHAPPSERAALLALARDRAATTVIAAPARSAGWGHLLMTEHALHGVTSTALEALRLSHLTGRHEPPLRQLRLQFGLDHWGELTPELRSLTRRQLTDMWAAGLYGELALVYTCTSAFGRALILAQAPGDDARRRLERTVQRAMCET